MPRSTRSPFVNLPRGPTPPSIWPTFLRSISCSFHFSVSAWFSPSPALSPPQQVPVIVFLHWSPRATFQLVWGGISRLCAGTPYSLGTSCLWWVPWTKYCLGTRWDNLMPQLMSSCRVRWSHNIPIDRGRPISTVRLRNWGGESRPRYRCTGTRAPDPLESNRVEPWHLPGNSLWPCGNLWGKGIRTIMIWTRRRCTYSTVLGLQTIQREWDPSRHARKLHLRWNSSLLLGLGIRGVRYRSELWWEIAECSARERWRLHWR